MYEEDYKLKHAWEKLEEKFVAQEKTPQQHLDKFKQSGGMEVGTGKNLLPPQLAFKYTKASRRRDANTPKGVDNRDFTLHEEDTNPKYKEFEQAILAGVKQANVDTNEDGEREERQTYDHPGVHGWGQYTNTISFPIKVNLTSNEDLELFKNYIFGYDPATDSLIPSIFEDILYSPESYFQGVQEIDSDYSPRSDSGWIELKIKKENDGFIFSGVWVSYTDKLRNKLDFEWWSENRPLELNTVAPKQENLNKLYESVCKFLKDIKK